MNRLACSLLALVAFAPLVPASAQTGQPAGVHEALRSLVSEPGTHTSFSLDRDMIDAILSGEGAPPASLSSITFENYRYPEPAFYIPEAMHALIRDYDRAGWKHLVEATANPRDSASPHQTLTDLWMHFDGADVDHLTVLLRAPREMTVIEVAGQLRPLDLLHLSGHFGIPKVDPNAVMVPAPPGH